MAAFTRRSFIAWVGTSSLALLGGCAEKAQSYVALSITNVSGKDTKAGWEIGTTVEYVAEHITPDNAGLLNVRLVFYDENKEIIERKILGDYRPQKLPDSSWEKKDNGGPIGDWGDGDDHFIDYTEQATTTISKIPKWISFSYERSEEMYKLNSVIVAQYNGPREPGDKINPDHWNLVEVKDRRAYRDPANPKTPILPET